MFEFFKSSNEGGNQKKSKRIELNAKEQWPELIELSHQHPVFIFKHSGRCGISSMVLSRFEKQINERNSSYFFLHIQNFRSLSNYISQELGIRHESPQLIVLKEARVLAHDSHYGLLDILPNMN